MKNMNCKGVTLVELMIGMTIGLIVLAAISSVYISARQTARTNEAAARIQETGRFALTLIADHLAHAGYYGRPIVTSTITGRSTDPVPVTYTVDDTDCATNWVSNLNVPLLIQDDTNPYSGTCIADVTSGNTQWNWMAGTDILEIRNANPIASTAPFPAGQLHIRGDLNSGAIYFGNTAPAAGNFTAVIEDHAINAYAYYIANLSYDDGATFVPALMRVASTPFGSDIRLENQEVFPFVENMQIEAGMDTNDDGDADTWAPGSSAIDYTQVRALRIWLLVRSESLDSAFNPEGSPIDYVLGNTTVTRNDRFRRGVFVKTVRLRNMNNL